MTKFIIVLICLFPLAGTGQTKFQVSGNLSGVKSGGVILLRYKNSRGKDTRDSTFLKNGRFLFNGTTAFANKATLSLLPVSHNKINGASATDEQVFYLEKGRYKFTGHNSINTASLTGGTQAQADYLQYQKKISLPSANYRAVVNQFMKVYNGTDTVEKIRLQTKAKLLYPKVLAATDSFIFSHPDSYVSLDLVDDMSDIIEPEVFDPYYKSLSKRVLASFTGQKLIEVYEKAKRYAVGKSFDFSQPDIDGNHFKLSSLKGKYVLIDFWASWCGPCRAESPFLLKAYQALKDKKFEIVGFSLDNNKTAWLKAVSDDGMPWLQVSDLKGFKNDVAVELGISAIPQNILVNPDGIIIAKNLRGEGLTQMLSAFIK